MSKAKALEVKVFARKNFNLQRTPEIISLEFKAKALEFLWNLQRINLFAVLILRFCSVQTSLLKKWF
jgi:hypothetical protein